MPKKKHIPVAVIAAIITGICILIAAKIKDSPSAKIIVPLPTQESPKSKKTPEEQVDEEPNLSKYLSEEQIRKKISDLLQSDNVKEAVKLLEYMKSDKARNEVTQSVFEYCVNNGKIDEANSVIEYFTSDFMREEAKKRLALEKLKYR